MNIVARHERGARRSAQRCGVKGEHRQRQYENLDAGRCMTAISSACCSEGNMKAIQRLDIRSRATREWLAGA
jgi:hypothetical protein